MPLILLDVLCGHVNTAKPKAINTDHIISIEQERNADPEKGTPAVSRITLNGGRTVDVQGDLEDVLVDIEDEVQGMHVDRAAGMAQIYTTHALRLMGLPGSPPVPPGTVDVPLDANGAPKAPPPQEANPAAAPDPAAS